MKIMRNYPILTGCIPWVPLTSLKYAAFAEPSLQEVVRRSQTSPAKSDTKAHGMK